MGADETNLVEEQLRTSPHIKNAIVLGNQKPHAIVLIIPTSAKVRKNDLNSILRKINDNLPSQSRLTEERICVLGPDEEFYMSPKGMVVRSKTEEKFMEVIESLYE